jgi:hypothetical protein
MLRFGASGAVTVGAWLATAGLAVAAPGPVSVFPSPGTKWALPATQIAFRGVSVGSLGPIQVVGSRTGQRAGVLRADSDGEGASFVPTTRFTPGETVTVTTGLDVLGGTGGVFTFTIATTAPRIGRVPLALVPAGSGGLQHFRSRRDLIPPAVVVKRRSSAAAPGDIFVANQFGPAQNGPMILDPSGNLVWFRPMPKDAVATDFRVQSYQGKPVLTWWQGYLNAGVGIGEGVVYDTGYHQLAIVKAADGLQADLHEFLLTPRGTALILAPSPVYTDLSTVHGAKRGVVIDWVVQEIDVKTGLLLFEWHSLDHIGLAESYEPLPTAKGHPADPYHVNSVGLDRDGNVLIGARNTWAAYKVSYQTGAVIWRLGGKQSSFKMGRGAGFAWQHDIRVQSDGTITLFDDGAAPPVHKQSRAIRLAVDTTHMSATLVREYDHTPALLAGFEGGSQALPGGDSFVGWGQQPYFSEFDSRGGVLFDARFVAPTPSYRAYRLPWTASPSTLPAIAAAAGRGGATVYASWNGATQVASWRALAGASRKALKTLNTARRRGFETTIGVRSAGPYFAVQALDASGRVLATSLSVHVS